MSEQKIQKSEFFDAKLQGESFLIRILQNPTDESQMHEFFQLHESKLKEIKTTKKTRMFLDLSELSFSATLLFYIPPLLKHFLRLQPESNRKLKACSVCVSNSYAASIIQPYLEKYPGEVPTFISSDEEACRQFLRRAK